MIAIPRIRNVRTPVSGPEDRQRLARLAARLVGLLVVPDEWEDHRLRGVAGAALVIGENVEAPQLPRTRYAK
jgi:hypothetical protein